MSCAYAQSVVNKDCDAGAVATGSAWTLSVHQMCRRSCQPQRVSCVCQWHVRRATGGKGGGQWQPVSGTGVLEVFGRCQDAERPMRTPPIHGATASVLKQWPDREKLRPTCPPSPYGPAKSSRSPCGSGALSSSCTPASRLRPTTRCTRRPGTRTRGPGVGDGTLRGERSGRGRCGASTTAQPYVSRTARVHALPASVERHAPSLWTFSDGRA